MLASKPSQQNGIMGRPDSNYSIDDETFARLGPSQPGPLEQWPQLPRRGLSTPLTSTSLVNGHFCIRKVQPPRLQAFAGLDNALSQLVSLRGNELHCTAEDSLTLSDIVVRVVRIHLVDGDEVY